MPSVSESLAPAPSPTSLQTSAYPPPSVSESLAPLGANQASTTTGTNPEDNLATPLSLSLLGLVGLLALAAFLYKRRRDKTKNVNGQGQSKKPLTFGNETLQHNPTLVSGPFRQSIVKNSFGQLQPTNNPMFMRKADKMSFAQVQIK
jgi:LPXTG-motif cell wall-anchored protein